MALSRRYLVLLLCLYWVGLRASDLNDDARWSPLAPSGPNGPVYAMATYNGHLYIGGDFNSVGGVAADNLARWDGSTWHALPYGSYQGPNGPVQALLVHGGRLNIAGAFSSIGMSGTMNIASWNGSWGSLGGGAIARSTPSPPGAARSTPSAISSIMGTSRVGSRAGMAAVGTPAATA